MRHLSFLPILVLVAGLVAWVERDAQPLIRVAILHSLDNRTAARVVTAFKADLRHGLDAIDRSVAFTTVHLTDDPAIRPPQMDSLLQVDLVVTFGTLAALQVEGELREVATPHLFALVPQMLAERLYQGADSARARHAIGIVRPLPTRTAVAIVERLLLARQGSHLRVGLIHPSDRDGRGHDEFVSSDDDVGRLSFVHLPFDQPRRANSEALALLVVEAAVGGVDKVDAFWLDSELAAPVDRLVQAIEQRTGRPVIFAPAEAGVTAGALMSLAPSPMSVANESARHALRILDGEVPASPLPLTPFNIELALNLDTADRLGIVPPHELLELAHGRLFR